MLHRTHLFGCFALLCFISVTNLPKAMGGDHGALLVASSKSQLTELGEALPAELLGQISSFSENAFGPILSAARPDSPLGAWVDWSSGIPQTVAFVGTPNIEQFESALAVRGLKTEATDAGIRKIDLPVALYFKETDGLLFFAYDEEQLRNIRSPLAQVSLETPLTLHLNLDQIPMDSKQEISATLALRLVPKSIALANEVGPDLLLQQYVKRLCDDALLGSESASLALNRVGDGEIQLSIDLKHTRPSNRQAVNSTLLEPPTGTINPFSMHTFLRSSESTQLSWWANALPELVGHEFDSTDVQDREGRAALMAGAELIREQLQQIALGKEISGFFAFAASDEPAAVIGLKIPSTRWTTSAVEEFLQQDLSGLGVLQTEPTFQTLEGIDFHRLTFGEYGETFGQLVIAVGQDCLFLTDGDEGLETLNEHIRSHAGTTRPASPLRVTLDSYGIGAGFGWATQDLRVEVDSEYRRTGIHYDLVFSANNRHNR